MATPVVVPLVGAVRSGLSSSSDSGCGEEGGGGEDNLQTITASNNVYEFNPTKSSTLNFNKGKKYTIKHAKTGGSHPR